MLAPSSCPQMVLPLPSTYPVPPPVLPASTVPVALHAPCALSPDQTSDAVEGRSAGVRPSLRVSQAQLLYVPSPASLCPKPSFHVSQTQLPCISSQLPCVPSHLPCHHTTCLTSWLQNCWAVSGGGVQRCHLGKLSLALSYVVLTL